VTARAGEVLALGALLALLGYGVALRHRGTGIDAAVAAGRRPTAPALSAAALGAPGRRSLAGYRGQVVVLNFWASWCIPCRDESPLLERWQRRLHGRRATVLGVDSLDVDSDARAFARRYHLTYPMAHDGGGAAARSYGTRGFPETFVIDRRGRIAALRRGPVDESFLRRSVPPLLDEPA